MDVVGNQSLPDLLIERAGQLPDKPYLVWEAADGTVEQFTYAEFLAQVQRAAAAFDSLGITAGDAVVLHLPNCPEFLISWFGLNWIGAIMVPSNTANQLAELEHVVGFSEAVAVITTEPFLELFERLPAPASPETTIVVRSSRSTSGVVSFDDLMATDAPVPDIAGAADDTAEMIFTSGTTAKPKAVMLSHVNCIRSGEQCWRSLAVDRTDTFLSSLPAFHVNAQSFTILAALCVGGTCVLLEQYSASKFMSQVRRHRATVISLVAMQLRTLLAQPENAVDREHEIRRTLYALNVPEPEKLAFEGRFGVRLINGYGLSEAMTMVLLTPVFGEQRWPSLGLPVIDRTVRIVDDAGDDVGVGEPGEIILHGVPGRTIMKGYFKDPDATAAAVRDGWLYTGDNAVYDERGYVYFFDRKKDVIKRAGENISALEVESVLLSHPDIDDAAVIGVPDEIRDEAVKAFVVARPGSQVTRDDVIQHCRQRLASFKVPTVVEMRDALPRTSIGKIEKKALRAESGSG